MRDAAHRLPPRSPKKKDVAPQPEKTGYTIDRTYHPVEVNPVNQKYTINKLDDIVNLSQFAGFTEDQEKRLLSDYFFISPSDTEQPFLAYETNGYKSIPSFITSDSVLHSFHMFYDYTLKSLETDRLSSLMKDMTVHMLDASLQQYAEIKDSSLKKSAGKNAAYFAVAAELLGEDKDVKLPADMEKAVKEELKSIDSASGRSESAIFGFDIDYTQFIPRGHYTRTEELKNYFKAAMWYGTVPFPFEIDKKPAYDSVRQASLMTLAITNGQAAYDDYKELYDITEFLVGSSDDLNVYDYQTLLSKAVGDKISTGDLADAANLKKIIAEAKKLPAPKIQQDLEGIPGGQQFRFMGQRYVPDSQILQELSDYKARPFPKGLDPMAILGSDNAHDLLFDTYDEDGKWDKYAEKYDKLRTEFNGLTGEDWRENVYTGWLWSLKSLFEKEDYSPSFMQKEAWGNKQLMTGLGSWTELRHDTILYAKAAGAERGDGYSGYKPTGYVEPVPEFYNRLLWVSNALDDYVKYLQQNGADSDRMTRISKGYDTMNEVIANLRDISVKELEGKELTDDEWLFIYNYGAYLEGMTNSVVEDENGEPLRWFDLTSETDRNMACVADVHTSGDKCLEEGIGQAYDIYAAVPMMGKIYLTRGVCFNYYEFTWPTADRLTDEKWQQLLKDGSVEMPPWEKDMISDKKSDIPYPEAD